MATSVTKCQFWPGTWYTSYSRGDSHVVTYWELNKYKINPFRDAILKIGSILTHAQNDSLKWPLHIAHIITLVWMIISKDPPLTFISNHTNTSNTTWTSPHHKLTKCPLTTAWDPSQLSNGKHCKNWSQNVILCPADGTEDPLGAPPVLQ